MVKRMMRHKQTGQVVNVVCCHGGLIDRPNIYVTDEYYQGDKGLRMVIRRGGFRAILEEDAKQWEKKQRNFNHCLPSIGWEWLEKAAALKDKKTLKLLKEKGFTNKELSSLTGTKLSVVRTWSLGRSLLSAQEVEILDTLLRAANHCDEGKLDVIEKAAVITAVCLLLGGTLQERFERYFQWDLRDTIES